MRDKVKMRKSKYGGECDICGVEKDRCLDLFDLALGRDVFTVCDECVDKIFRRTLSAICHTNKRLKSQRDIKIINARAKRDHLNYGRGLSDLNEDEIGGVE